MRVNRDAVLMPRPRTHHGMLEEMMHAANSKLGIPKDDHVILNVFDGPSHPSQTEIVMTHRLGISTITTAEVSIVEALRACKINSLLISQSTSITHTVKDITKEVERFMHALATEQMLQEMDKLEVKFYIQIKELENSHRATMEMAYAIREKYVEKADPANTMKLYIVF